MKKSLKDPQDGLSVPLAAGLTTSTQSIISHYLSVSEVKIICCNDKPIYTTSINQSGSGDEKINLHLSGAIITDFA